MAYAVLHRKWPVRKWTWIPLLVAELAVLIPILVLFGIAQPDMYRTLFWRIGYENGFNSNPNMRIFAMVNNEPLPTVPFVWSRMLTDFNVAISIVNLFILLSRMIALIMKVCYPIVALIVNTCLVTLWTVSVYGQIGPDNADPEQKSAIAWYIAKSCDIAKPYNAENKCYIAKASFALTVVMLAVMVAHLGIAIWAMLPTKETEEYDSDDEDEYQTEPKQVTVEMTRIRSPNSPPPIFTPRTQAFHTLDRKLPLRSG